MAYLTEILWVLSMPAFIFGVFKLIVFALDKFKDQEAE